MARLQIAMRELVPELGQRPGWRPQHTATTVNADICWRDCIDALSAAHQGLAEWAEAAAAATAAELAAIGADELPLTLIHGDFASWNVHYVGAELVGVIDFGLSHLDSRPYELAIARTYRAVEVRDGFRDELARVGSPLTDLEERAIEPIQRAFRVDMVAWALDAGLRTGRFDVEMIESQLARTGTSRPR
jgi:homoserine kinase type II